MDFRLNNKEEKFRAEVRDFLRKELPDWFTGGVHLRGCYYQHAVTDEEWAFCRSLQRKLGQKGWLSLTWPREYGGREAPRIYDFILGEQLAIWRAPGLNVHGVRLLGPILLGSGTEEQKRRYLPAIAKGEIWWCQAFSEPNAGSDLASLQLKAEKDGDDYILNGQKIWTSGADRADWCFLLARTDPDTSKRHKGISFLLVDMKSQGITVRPVSRIGGSPGYSEVFFENVRVPRENLVGQENRGWYVAMSALGLERSAIRYPGAARTLVEELISYVNETWRNGELLANDRVLRHKLAQLGIETEVARLLSYRVAWMQTEKLPIVNEASVAKLFGTELLKRVAGVAMEILGFYGELDIGSKWAQYGGRMGHDYYSSLMTTVGAGTSEIQRNTIATRGLGLPT